MSFLRTSKSSNAPASCALAATPPKMKEAAASIYMNRLNIGSPWVESLFVTRAGARPMEFCYPPAHTNGPKLGSDCDEPMTVSLQLREIGRASCRERE